MGRRRQSAAQEQQKAPIDNEGPGVVAKVVRQVHATKCTRADGVRGQGHAVPQPRHQLVVVLGAVLLAHINQDNTSINTTRGAQVSPQDLIE